MSLNQAYKNEEALDPTPESCWGKLLALVPAGTRVLDVGCGNGAFAATLKRLRGCSVVGIEIDAERARLAAERCDRVISGDAVSALETDLVGEEFDVVILADVLEHLLNPQKLLRLLPPRLGKTGLLLASIPNVTHASVILSLARGRFPRSEEGLLDATHVQFFGEQDVRELFESSGYVAAVADRVRIQPESTEFRTDLGSVPEEVLDFLGQDRNSDTYQFIVRAQAAGSQPPSSAFIEAAAPDAKPVRNRLVARIHDLEEIMGKYEPSLRASLAENRDLHQRLVESHIALQGKEGILSQAQAESAQLHDRLGKYHVALEEKGAILLQAQAESAQLNERLGAAHGALEEKIAVLSRFEKELAVFRDQLERTERERVSLRTLASRLRASLEEAHLARRKKDAENAAHRGQDKSNGQEWREPNPLFDSRFYYARYPDVAASGGNPFVHFVTHGVSEGRDPGPFFRSRYYCERYPDIAAAGVSPVMHFLRVGAVEGRSPHPAFDSTYYLKRYPDVRTSGLNPYLHFLRDGIHESRKPFREFDPATYREVRPEAFQSSLPPWEYLVRSALDEDVAEVRRRWRARLLPPVTPPRAAPLELNRVDVIVPAYRGLEETRRCIESVLSMPNETPLRLVVVEDGSPDADLVRYLCDLPTSERLVLVRNATNQGFVRSVNIGMSQSESSDVVLLNSDAEVGPYWLDRLVFHAYEHPGVGTVSPLSNNATICSYPVRGGSPELPKGEDLQSLNEALFEANRGRSVAIPTTVGFCMYVRRDCLNEIGLFDAEAFGRGYGEENDFCMRATAEGWLHLMALDTYVYHRGEVSFRSEASGAKERATAVLLERHPHYSAAVSAYVNADPGEPSRMAATAARFRRSGRPVMLLISHALEGGVGRHVRELIRRVGHNARFVALSPRGRSFVLSLPTEPEPFDLDFGIDSQADMDALVGLLRSFGVSRAHIHHVLGFSLAHLRQLVRSLGVPFDFTVHDYYSICPRIFLIGPDGDYCGEPSAAGCNDCIRNCPGSPAADITLWRRAHDWLLRDAARVITPSKDTANRISKYAPHANVLAVPHEPDPSRGVSLQRFVPLRPDEPLCVGIVGVLTEHKGLRRLLGVARAALTRGRALRFVVVGSIEGDTDGLLPENVSQTGEYKESGLLGLLKEEGVRLVWFPAPVPETYSYTLSAALAAGLPVLAPRLGAFPERLAGRPSSWLFEPTLNPLELVHMLDELRSHFEARP